MIRKLFYFLLLVTIFTTLSISGCGKLVDTSGGETSAEAETTVRNEVSSGAETIVTETSSETVISSAQDETTTPDPSTGTSSSVETTTFSTKTNTPATDADTTDTAAETSSTEETSTETDTSSTEETPAETDTSSTEETSTETSSADIPSSPLTLSDVAFIGDSRTLTMASGGRYEFSLLPASSVFATWGGELTQESARTNALAAGNAGRKLAVFWYGINDVQSDPEQKYAAQFVENYVAIIDIYRNANPDSDIVILSILSTSVNEKDYYDGQEENIRTYNEGLAALCAEEGYTYLDITELFTGDECLAPGDYIHFSKEWYEERFIPKVFGALGIES